MWLHNAPDVVITTCQLVSMNVPGGLERSIRCFGNTSCMCWLSEALIESRQFIRWLHRWRPYIASLYWRTRHLLLRFICLQEAAILALLLRFFWPDFVRFLLGFLRLHFGDCSSGTLFSSWWSAMEYRRCQLPCPLYIASDGPHSNCVKCMGFSHTPEVVLRHLEMQIIWKLPSQNPPH